MKDPDRLLTKMLVIWYGLYQAVHLIINASALTELARRSPAFPALPPPGGWSDQVIHFFVGMASLDLFNALLTLIFVYGYFRQTKWRWWLGTLTLTISMYAAVVFDYATLVSGAWPGNLAGYLFINVTFIPVIVLFGLFCYWGLRGVFGENRQ